MTSPNEDLIEQIAEVIYRHAGGICPEEFENVFGKPQRHWKTDAPRDTRDDELQEHERDEYRLQARKVVETVASYLLLDGKDKLMVTLRTKAERDRYRKHVAKLRGMLYQWLLVPEDRDAQLEQETSALLAETADKEAP